MTKRLILLVLVAATGLAQQNPNAPLRLGESLLHIPTPRLLSGERGEVRFTHRFQTPINEGDVHSLWGLDGSADIGLGLSWQPQDRLLLSLFRSDVLDDYELAAKFVLLDHTRSPCSFLSAAEPTFAPKRVSRIAFPGLPRCCWPGASEPRARSFSLRVWSVTPRNLITSSTSRSRLHGRFIRT